MVKPIEPDYNQLLLLPPSVEDWVHKDDPVRFIRDFVDCSDLEKLGFAQPECRTGRPPYAPSLLLKVWLYRYYNGIRSTRKLEQACYQHMGLIWPTGNNPPDHNALWRFFNKNRDAMRELFKKSVLVAVHAKLIDFVTFAMDGVKIPASWSSEKARNRKQLESMLERVSENVDGHAADLMAEVDRAEREESGSYRLSQPMHNELKRKQRINEALEEIDATDKKAVHPSEPEARFMKNRRSKELSYNGQAVADAAGGLIVAADVVTDGADNGQLVPMLDLVKDTVGRVARENVADAGFFSSSQIALAEERKYPVLVSKSSGEVKSEKDAAVNPYHRSRFVYDEARDCCLCPMASVLPFHQRKSHGANNNEVRRYRCRDFATCANRWDCSKSKNGRLVDVSVHYQELERHREKRERPESQKLLKARKTIIEPVFGWIKQCMGFRRWTVTGIDKVRAQWSLVCTAINLKKLYGCWAEGKLDLAPG